ncbi:hypothetical protein BC833DRAFT_612366 [Globomyces pollinis-pini]|nr:hypothetical protein BC833DRAFT_612366 [Globomyces pollinis-pini]
MSAIHCFFCGGKECKYENYKLWSPDKYAGTNALDGLFSSWITDNILAMQRPSTRLIKEYHLLEKFIDQKVLSIFNLQTFGEHASCADGIDPQTGFSYNPDHFMDKGISYYNFGWTDMDIPNMETMLNIVGVMAFSLDAGKKIAVHCHAGLGRTGLSIACYLVFGLNYTATNAITLVRTKRPLSVQTKKQVLFVNQFDAYLKTLKRSFSGLVGETANHSLTFEEFLGNQRKWLTHKDLGSMRHIPKIIYKLIHELMKLCSSPNNEPKWFEAVDAFINFEGIAHQDSKMISIQMDINKNDWKGIEEETDSKFIVQLLLYWIIHLKSPMISDESLRFIQKSDLPWPKRIDYLNKDVFESLNYILLFFRKVPSISKTTLDLCFQRLSVCLTSERIMLEHASKCVPMTLDNKLKVAVHHNPIKTKPLISPKTKQQSFSRFRSSSAAPSLTPNQVTESTDGKVAVTDTKVIPTATMQEPEELALDIPSVDTCQSLLHFMYQTFSCNEYGQAVYHDSKLNVTESSWMSPVEIVQKLPLGSKMNLATQSEEDTSLTSSISALASNLIPVQLRPKPVDGNVLGSKLLNNSTPNLTLVPRSLSQEGACEPETMDNMVPSPNPIMNDTHAFAVGP